MIFSANIGVKNSVGFFICDVFCRINHDCDEFGGNFSHITKTRLFKYIENFISKN